MWVDVGQREWGASGGPAVACQAIVLSYPRCSLGSKLLPQLASHAQGEVKVRMPGIVLHLMVDGAWATSAFNAELSVVRPGPPHNERAGLDLRQHAHQRANTC